MLRAGQIIENYQIIEKIGEGGMGVVYKARDMKLDRTVALKFIGTKYFVHSEFRKRLALEARRAASINSNHVVKIWDYIEANDLSFISMEYVSGDNLFDSAAQCSIQDKLAIAKQIAEGLSAAHKMGVIHRDLKPDNIKITKSGDIKVFDFGVAQNIRADTVDAQGEIEGTIQYMSPEQLSGSDLTPSSDIFSFGIILYELFTHRKPFEGEYAASVIYSIIYEDPIPPKDLNQDIPDWLNAFLLRLLAKNPEARFPDFDAIIPILEEFRSGFQAVGRTAFYESPPKTVTVIDVNNLSGDDTWDYFCLGFTEDLIREISRRCRLIVSARPSSVYSRDIQKVFQHCRSDFVITGSLMKWQNEVKLNLAIHGDNGRRMVFGETYQDNAKRLFELLAKSAGQVASMLSKETGEILYDVNQYLKTDISAYEYYLKGRSYYQTNKPDDLEHAIKMYYKALDNDPDFALAYTGLSDVYAFQYMAYYDRTPEKIELARINAEKALEIDPHLPEAERSLGRYYMFNGLFSKAEDAFRRCISINPKFAVGYRTLAWLYTVKGDNNLALDWAKKALCLAPTDLEILLLISLIYIDQRKFTLALATLQRAIELGPDYGRAYYNLGLVYMKLGVLDLALNNFDLANRYQGDPNSYIEAGYIHLLQGKYKKAEELLRESIAVDNMPFIALYYLGFLNRLQGKDDQADKYFGESVASTERFEKEDPDNIYILAYKALALAALNCREASECIIQKVADASREQGDVMYIFARCYQYFREYETADRYIYDSLDKIASPTIKEIQFDPHFSNRKLRLPDKQIQY